MITPTPKFDSPSPGQGGRRGAKSVGQPPAALTSTGTLILAIAPNQVTINEGQSATTFTAKVTDANGADYTSAYTFDWQISPDEGTLVENGSQASWEVQKASREDFALSVIATPNPNSDNFKITGQVGQLSAEAAIFVAARPLSRFDTVSVGLERGSIPADNSESLSLAIRASTDLLSFTNYKAFVDRIMCDGAASEAEQGKLKRLGSSRGSPFPGVDAYQLLKTSTELYVMLACGVLDNVSFQGTDLQAYKGRHGRSLSLSDLEQMWSDYLVPIAGSDGGVTLPYLELIRRKLGDQSIISSPNSGQEQVVRACLGILEQKLTQPCLLELIWSYWQEEAMTVQTLNAVCVRFQNQRTSDRDPLAQLDIDPLRPMSNLIWGYIQDEQHRLTLVRRAYEYDHHYGISLHGKAVPVLNPADSRSKFLEGFHNLLHAALLFYKQDDNTMVKADGFPVLNGLKEVHLLLAEGAHNQFGDLPFTARIEMLMQQWLLARPEMRDFIGGRTMMPYTEEWMDRVDGMKRLQNWTDVSVTYFSELARFGEQLLLSIRYGDWNEVQDPNVASNWAREWRAEVKRYVHSYRAATGVDLSPELSDIRLAADRYLAPSVHLRKRLDAQRNRSQNGGGRVPSAPARNGHSSVADLLPNAEAVTENP